MRILLTNDDGINAPGIKALWQKLNSIGEVFVVAPSFEQSAMSQAITVHSPIRVDSYPINAKNVIGWSIGGTPTDCVKLGLETLLTEKPDIIISGINLGSNLGSDVLYSGTVSAAIEGALHRIPSIAISLDKRKDADFLFSAKFSVKLIKKILQEKVSENTLLNVNIPAILDENNEEVAITKLGVREYTNSFDKRQDPSGRNYYWMGGQIADSENKENTDVFAVKNGKVSITPIHFDLTNYQLMKTLENWHMKV